MSKMPNETEITNYDLDTPYCNSYANTMNQLVLRYQFRAEERYKAGTHYRDTVFALLTILQRLPSKGKAYMKAEFPMFEKYGFNAQQIYNYLSYEVPQITSPEHIYEVCDDIFNYAQSWIEPNIFELYLNVGKPAYGTDSHLGNKR